MSQALRAVSRFRHGAEQELVRDGLYLLVSDRIREVHDIQRRYLAREPSYRAEIPRDEREPGDLDRIRFFVHTVDERVFHLRIGLCNELVGAYHERLYDAVGKRNGVRHDVSDAAVVVKDDLGLGELES